MSSSTSSPTHTGSIPDAVGVEQHTAVLLAHGPDLPDHLGRHSAAADAVRHELDAITRGSSELLHINRQLMPLLRALRRPGWRSSWKRWFTGEQLERDVCFHTAQHQIETLIEIGQRSHPQLVQQALRLKRHHELMGTEIRCLELDLAAARLLLGPDGLPRCRAAGLDDDDLARLERRVAHLESLLTATQLTREQFKVALRHARDASDRYREIRTRLLPIWKQAVGCDLLAHHTAPGLSPTPEQPER